VCQLFHCYRESLVTGVLAGGIIKRSVIVSCSLRGDSLDCHDMPTLGKKLRRNIKRVLFTGADNHSDLDSDAANATDAKYSEILQTKQKNLGKRSTV